MKKRIGQVLAVGFAGSITVGLIVAFIYAFTAGSTPKNAPNPPPPSGTSINDYRDPDGYVSSFAQYQGQEQHRLDGKELGADRKKAIEERLLGGQVGYSAHEVEDLNTLLKQTNHNATPIVVNIDDVPTNDKALSVEQRAIQHTMDRIDRHLPVNLLMGTQYALGADSYAQLQEGRYNYRRQGLEVFLDPVAYLEKQGTEIVVVLVTAESTFQEQFDEYYVDQLGGGLDKFFTSPDGLTYITQAKGDFVTTREKYNVWDARTMMGNCTVDPLNSGCLYKVAQKNLAFQGDEQVILVSPLSVYEIDEQATDDGHRRIHTQYVVEVPDGTLLRAARGYGQNVRYGPHTPQSEKVTGLLKRGGHALNSDVVWTLPAYKNTR